MTAHPVKEYSSVDGSLAAARAKIHRKPEAEVLPTRKAFGRVASEDITAPTDVPAFATSHWDGFAVIAKDLERAAASSPMALKVIGAAGPGESARQRLRHGEALHVATGAPMPSGSDAVVPVESASVDGRRLIVKFSPEPGSHVYRAGEDVKRGELVLARGKAIRAQDISLLLAFGLSKVKVWKEPRVSVIATGSELTDAEKPERGKVRNTHSALFIRLCEALGCLSIDMGIAADEPRVVAAAVRKALARSDIVITLGGTSAGRHDVVVKAVSSLRPGLVIHGIAMDRGRVTGLAVVKGKPVLMMPGPVQGAMTAFLLLGVPLISLKSGRRDAGLRVLCRMGEDWEARKAYASFRKVVYVKLEAGEDLAANPLAAETESVKILADADGYIVVPEDVTRIEKGSRVEVRLLPGFSSFW